MDRVLLEAVIKNTFYPLFWFLVIFGCKPLVTTFSDTEEAKYYEASSITDPVNQSLVENPIVMTWNIRFGIGRSPWFGDSCGERSIMTDREVLDGLDGIKNFLDTISIKPDIILIQEIDIGSKRTGYIDQVQWILDSTYLNYGAYASMWDSQFIASDGLGMVDVGNAILSRYPIEDAERIKLALRTDQDPLTQYFYLRRNILRAKIQISDEDIIVFNAHATAFATDDTKQKHIDMLYDTIEQANSDGSIFIAGGDLNSIPPGSSQYNFCEEDRCDGDICEANDDGPHLEGSYFNNFDGERDILSRFYQNFFPAISEGDAITSKHNTHSTWTTDDDSRSTDIEYWDRKLDYLFTNRSFNNGTTYQNAHQLSDHAPVSARLGLD